MLKNMAIDAGLPSDRKITNHSVRKHLVQKLRSANIPPTEIMAITGHKNVQSLINYSSITDDQQKRCSNILSAPAPQETPSNPNVDDPNCSSFCLPNTHTNTPRPIPTFLQNSQVALSKTQLSSQFYGAIFNV